MKDKFGAISKIIVVILIALLICLGLILLFDKYFDGAVGDWFKTSFVGFDSWSTGTSTVYTEFLMWDKLKTFLIYAAIGLAAFWALTALAFYAIGSHRMKNQATQTTARFIRDYLISEEGTVNVPKEYQDISQYLSEIKKQNQKNEQLMLIEVSKKNELIAYLAHDLKTPLTSVVGYLSLLEEAPDMPTAQKAKYAHIALEKALRLESLINEFFEITRYNLHQIVLEKEQIDLSYMLHQIADEFYPMLHAHGNTVTVTADESLTVHADPYKLARVFQNLLKNAIAYSHADSPIAINACLSEDIVLVSFTNLGPTIPSHQLNSIFEKFYRLDNARSSNTGGAGLGLAIAKEIIIQHGGSITAVSENQSTTFTVQLPG